MNLTDQNRREKEFHNELQTQSKGRFENIFYKAIYFLLNEFEFDNLNQKCIFASNERFKWIQKYINP